MAQDKTFDSVKIGDGESTNNIAVVEGDYIHIGSVGFGFADLSITSTTYTDPIGKGRFDFDRATPTNVDEVYGKLTYSSLQSDTGESITTAISVNGQVQTNTELQVTDGSDFTPVNFGKLDSDALTNNAPIEISVKVSGGTGSARGVFTINFYGLV